MSGHVTFMSGHLKVEHHSLQSPAEPSPVPLRLSLSTETLGSIHLTIEGGFSSQHSMALP